MYEIALLREGDIAETTILEARENGKAAVLVVGPRRRYGRKIAL